MQAVRFGDIDRAAEQVFQVLAQTGQAQQALASVSACEWYVQFQLNVQPGTTVIHQPGDTDK